MLTIAKVAVRYQHPGDTRALLCFHFKKSSIFPLILGWQNTIDCTTTLQNNYYFFSNCPFIDHEINKSIMWSTVINGLIKIFQYREFFLNCFIYFTVRFKFAKLKDNFHEFWIRIKNLQSSRSVTGKREMELDRWAPSDSI